MCRAVSCRRCGRPSWRGCGALSNQFALADNDEEILLAVREVIGEDTAA